jgi:hypothetical protein
VVVRPRSNDDDMPLIDSAMVGIYELLSLGGAMTTSDAERRHERHAELLPLGADDDQGEDEAGRLAEVLLPLGGPMTIPAPAQSGCWPLSRCCPLGG